MWCTFHKIKMTSRFSVGNVETLMMILETDDEVSDHWQTLRYNILVDDYVDDELWFVGRCEC